PLQSLALDRHISIVAAHHDNKTIGNEDWVYSISGTQAIAGTADTLFGLARRVGSDLAILKTHGRDTDESNLLLRLKQGGTFNRGGRLINVPFGWSVIGQALGNAQLTAEREAIIRILDDEGQVSVSDLARRFSDETYDAMRVRLSRMADNGLLLK